MILVTVLNYFSFSLYLGSFLPSIPIDSLFSTQGIMIMLLIAYAGAMWMFLSSAPKVYTVMVSDLSTAQRFYEGLLNLPVAEIPLHYYYNYEQSLSAASFDPIYLSATPNTPNFKGSEGLWYQLKKNSQLHIISGASYGDKDQHRHVCFDKDCLEQILLKVQSRRLKYKIRREKPLNFLVKDLDNRILEFSEVSN